MNLLSELFRSSLAGLLAFALAIPVLAETSALEELKQAGGVDEVPAVAPASGMPVAAAAANPQGTLACTMSFKYTEKVTSLVVIRLWKKIEGNAEVSCPGHDTVRLRMLGEGLSLGLGIPNKSPFKSTNEGIAGSIQIHVSLPLKLQNFEGDYVNIGAEIIGIGASLSPWINQDKSLNMTLYLPSTFNAGAAINLQKLTLFLI